MIDEKKKRGHLLWAQKKAHTRIQSIRFFLMTLHPHVSTKMGIYC